MSRQTNSRRISVLIHLFYTDLYSEFIPYLSEIREFTSEFYFNIGFCKDRVGLIKRIQEDFPRAFIMECPNIGKDLGGKLALIELYLKLEQKSDYLILIHDKRSPQLLNGDEWRNQLLSILRKEKIEQSIELFEKDKSIGIIGSSDHLSNEYDSENKLFRSTNNLILHQFITKFNLLNADFSFVAGNMFWVRSSIYEKFFTQFPPLDIRASLESGNVMDDQQGTFTHSMERIFSWIALSQGYVIKGV
jgi:lipopolysaccharide biosynthesis protein